MKILKDFAGASIGDYTIEGNKIFCKIRKEKINIVKGAKFDYSLHYNFGVENTSNKKKDIEIFINCKDKNDIPDKKALIFSRSNTDEEFKRYKSESTFNQKKSKYHIVAKLKPKEKIYVSNTYFRDYDKLTTVFDKLGENAEKVKFGESYEGRPLYYYKFSNNKHKKNNVLLISGTHPMEPDTLATESLMEYFNSEEGKELLETFNVYTIPLFNPDGFILGLGGCNAKGTNLFWNFDYKNKTDSPEAYHLFKLANEIKPILYFDFHAYTFHLEEKHASPYIKPLIFYDGPKVRELVSKIHERELELSKGKFIDGYLTYIDSTLASHLTNTYNTITYAKYHLHIRESIEINKKLSIECVTSAMKIIKEKFSDPEQSILKKPHGSVKPNKIPWLKRIAISKVAEYVNKAYLIKKRIENARNKNSK